jgi:3-deoxy-alpha-D-manno-octulosonate 8-oxidase
MKNNKNVQFYIFGNGSIKELGNIIKSKRESDSSIVVFVVDMFFKGKDLVNVLPIKPNDLVMFIDTTDEPHAEYVDSLVQDIKNKCQSVLPVAVVGIGGGTTMDIAKCISILLTNPGKAQGYQGWDLVKNPAVYKIGIPTISGTGAEVSRTAVITSKTQKLGMNSDHSVFDQIILDPNLMKTVPKDQFFYTAMDCYIHCVESLRGSMIDEMSRAFAEKGLELVREVFLKEMNYGKLMAASFLGGLSVANTNVGICHPLSYGLALVLGYHHGIANCIAFNQLEEYYTKEVMEFHKIIDRHGIELPKNIMKSASNDKIDRMVAATLKNEKPLANAFGENWKQIFTPEKIRQILLRM